MDINNFVRQCRSAAGSKNDFTLCNFKKLHFFLSLNESAVFMWFKH